MTTPEIPKELFSRKNFFTLSGMAAAVWLTCFVLSGFFDKETLPEQYYKFIAIGLSEFLAIYVVIRDRRKTHRDNYLIAVFNGLLIFINASGYNAVSNGIFFSPKPEGSAMIVLTENHTYNAGFMAFNPFRSQAEWWPNLKKETEIKDLQEQLALYEEELSLKQTELDTMNGLLINLGNALEECKIDHWQAAGSLEDDQEACDIILAEKNREITDLEKRLAKCERKTGTDPTGLPVNYDEQSRLLRDCQINVRSLEAQNKKLLDSIKYCTQWKSRGRRIN